MEGCKDCDNAKKGFLLLNRIGIKNVAVMCTSCDTIWKDTDKE